MSLTITLTKKQFGRLFDLAKAGADLDKVAGVLAEGDGEILSQCLRLKEWAK